MTEISGVRDFVAENDLEGDSEAALDWDGTDDMLALVVGELVGVILEDGVNGKLLQLP